MKAALMLATWLLAAPPGGEVKDRACFQRCNEQIQACNTKCPRLAEATDDEDDGKPKKGKKPNLKQPTGPEGCHIACMKKSEPCLKGCK